MSYLLLLSLWALPIGQIRVLPSDANEDMVKSVSGLATGFEYSDQVASDAVRRLYTSGFYDYVAVDTSRIDSKVNVTIQVSEPPRLEKLEIAGNRRFKNSTLKKLLTADSGTVLTARQIFDWEKAIRNKYKEKRYLLVDVETKLIPTDREDYSIAQIRIEEGMGVRIRSITLEGNENVAEKKLKRKMKNRSKWFILRSGRFDEKKFQGDIDK
ncbi:hypothetical protein GF359_05915, partial [candidate division WOR-3 bacterium]|nr:hypothetical protein [candidate division WOR-3 bacterium]MBD3364734.1 hypothetical protein [candidate division WOR-3 bacterium]